MTGSSLRAYTTGARTLIAVAWVLLGLHLTEAAAARVAQLEHKLLQVEEAAAARAAEHSAQVAALQSEVRHRSHSTR
jgi:hypothetical protein